MKKIFNILLVMCSLLLGSCVNKVEDFFDQTASERLNAKKIECMDYLTSPEHGWLIHYYPSMDLSYGGATFAAKFGKDGYVEVTGDAAAHTTKDWSKVVKSAFSVRSHSSVLLSFDAYNTYIHYWSDPDIHRNVYDGDFEWVYVEGSEDYMVFTGIKTGNTIIFEPLKEDIVTTNLKIKPVFDYIYHDNIFDGFDCRDSQGNVTKIYKQRGYPRFTCDGVGLPYNFVPGGIRFYEPVQIGGTTLQYLTYDEVAKQLSSEESGLIMEGFFHERYQPYDTFLGKYRFRCTADRGQVDEVVEIVERERGKTFTLKGIHWRDFPDWGISGSDTMEWVLTFDPFDGALVCYCQPLREIADGWIIYLLPTNDTSWGWWPYESVGISLSHNNDPDNFVLTWNAPAGASEPNCFMMGRYRGAVGTTEWGYAMESFVNMQPLTKIYK